jgi:hypothetical protein
VKRKNWHSDVLTSGGRGIRQRLQPMLKSPAAGFAQIWSRYAAIGSRYGGRPAAIKRGVIIFPVKPAYRNRICPSRDRHPTDRRLSMRAFADGRHPSARSVFPRGRRTLDQRRQQRARVMRASAFCWQPLLSPFAMWRRISRLRPCDDPMRIYARGLSRIFRWT